MITLVLIGGTLGWTVVTDTQAPGRQLPTVPVVVAVRDVPEGATLDSTALMVVRWPAGTLPAGAYTSVDSVASRVTRVPVHRGEAIVPGRLAPVGTRPGFEVKITPGKRAYVIRVDNLDALAGLIKPNSRVDIMVVAEDARSPGKRVARLFMENMRVLAVGASSTLPQTGRPLGAGMVTIEVAPEEAARLSIAAAAGAFQLALRGDDTTAAPDVAR